MAVGQTVAATNQVAAKISSMLSYIRDSGVGPSVEAPHGDARKLGAFLAGGLGTSPCFAFGSVTVADVTKSVDIQLDFAPKMVFVVVESAVADEDALLMKWSSMGTGVQTDQTAMRQKIGTAGVAGGDMGSYIKMEEDGSTTIPKNGNAFNVDGAAIPQNADVFHWLAIG